MARVTGLGHIGLFVSDTQTVMDFYANFLGMTITDRADDDRIIFLRARPEAEHHELALVRRPETASSVQQVSFTVGSLAELKDYWTQTKARNFPVDRVVNHGIAFGCYFRDPEGNAVEIYWSTGKDYPQPHGDPLDLDLSEAELLRELAAMPEKTRAAV